MEGDRARGPGARTREKATRPVVWVIDRDPMLRRALLHWLAVDGHTVRGAAGPGDVSPESLASAVRVVLIGLDDRPGAALAWIARCRSLRPDVAVVATARRPALELAVQCGRHGAAHCLAAPLADPAALRTLLARLVAGGGTAAGVRPAGAPNGSTSVGFETIPLSLEAYERRALERALEENGGDAGAAARALGVGRSTFYRKLAKHGLRAGSVGAGDRRPGDLGAPGAGLVAAWRSGNLSPSPRQ